MSLRAICSKGALRYPKKEIEASIAHSFFCEPFRTNDTKKAFRNYATCGIYACDGQVIEADGCSEGYTGNMFYKLYDERGELIAANDDSHGDDANDDDDNAVGSNDDNQYDDYSVFGDDEDDDNAFDPTFPGGCDDLDDYNRNVGTCSKIIYRVSVVPDALNTATCRFYYLHQGCYGKGKCARCSGTTKVTGALPAPPADAVIDAISLSSSELGVGDSLVVTVQRTLGRELETDLVAVVVSGNVSSRFFVIYMSFSK